ncbi:hypothetical protein [Erwinia rhapontici]|uniref:hypothetical protein n=1 Tax=Erwinia rhapontici TaxID=55212 RepID=UPI003D3651B0
MALLLKIKKITEKKNRFFILIMHGKTNATGYEHSQMGIIKVIFLFLLLVPVFTQAREVSQINIVKTGAYDSEGRYEYEKEGCKTFNPTKEQLIHYFTKAEESDASGEWMNEYYSPCVASGTITFKDSSSGEWIIHSSGLRWVDFTEGKRKYFYYIDNSWEEE